MCTELSEQCKLYLIYMYREIVTKMCTELREQCKLFLICTYREIVTKCVQN